MFEPFGAKALALLKKCLLECYFGFTSFYLLLVPPTIHIHPLRCSVIYSENCEWAEEINNIENCRPYHRGVGCRLCGSWRTNYLLFTIQI